MNEGKSLSIFWPIVLIAVGLVWLLGNLNILPDFDFGLLLSLWPLLLIAGGLNLLIGRRMPLLRALITILFVGGAILYVYLAPGLGLVQTPEVLHAEFSEPVGEAASATIQLQSSIGRTRIEALTDSRNLIEASLDYVGEVSFEVEGTTEKTVSLSVQNDAFDGDMFDSFNSDDLQWQIGLSPDIPLVLDFSGGVGSIVLDLRGLQLSEVLVNSGVGSVNLILPAAEGMYTVEVRGGVGEFTIELEDGASVTLDIEGGVGDFVVETPGDAGVRVSANTGVGVVNVPSDFVLVSSEERTVGTTGTWESENFETAEYQILIDFNGGVGGLRVR